MAQAIEDTTSKFALIGAGPMGLAAAKVLVEQGIAFQGFELNSDVGGLWDIDGPRSTMYETAHLISSRTMTEFTDFPMRGGVAEYPSHREMKAYFHEFADRYDLPVLAPPIPRTVRFAEASASGSSVLSGRKNKGAIAYRDLANSLLHHWKSNAPLATFSPES